MNSSFAGVPENPTRVLIVGGGFGGIRTALRLEKAKIPNLIITLVSDRHHFEYTPALYKLATGKSPMETCIPLGDIIGKKKIEYVIDTITGGSVSTKTLTGVSGSVYHYDYLVLALGAETAYFGIPGVEQNAYTIKSVGSALKLKNHLHELFDDHSSLSKAELMPQFQFVIVGGGPAGVELAGEIRRYARSLARIHSISEKLVTVDILQAAPRLLPTMTETVSECAVKRLDKLGINIILNHAVTSEDEKGVYMKDIALNAKTVVWTAGVRPNRVHTLIQGLPLDKSGRILVDEHLKVLDLDTVFAIGDGAATPFSGTAQTAIYDGNYMGEMIANIIRHKKLPRHDPRITPYVVPIGEDWAVLTFKNITLSGRLFWWLRQIIDFKFFLSILPLGKAFTVWREGGMLTESCPTCIFAEEEALRNH